MEEEQKSMKEKVDMIFNQIYQEKKKKIKLPRKTKIKKRKIKKGWIGILRIDENGNICGEKQKIIDSAIKLKGGTYHASDGREILFLEGKYPVILQPTWKSNPLQIRSQNERNETYGQKYIMARMLGDTIKVKAQGAKAILWIIGIAVAGYIAYMLFTGGF